MREDITNLAPSDTSATTAAARGGYCLMSARRLKRPCRKVVKVYGERCEDCATFHHWRGAGAKERQKRKPTQRFTAEECLQAIRSLRSDQK
jgi:hypothetical protein